MKDRFSDVSKAIFDDKDFVEIENAIARVLQPDRRSTTTAKQSTIRQTTQPSHGKGTVSIETPRSESKTPEITVTPGSEVAVVGTEIEARLLSSSNSELPDSGCAGLLDDEDDESSHPDNQDNHSHHHNQNHRHQSSSVSGHRLLQQNQRLLHVDGPLDGSPYAVLVKQKPVETGISVDQMKDLDRLIRSLVEEAESIDIPYHARQDSLPFSYTSPQSIAQSQERRAQQQQQSQSQSSQQKEYSSSYSGGGGGVNHYSSVASPPYTAPPDPYSSSRRGGGDVYDHGTSYLDQQTYNPRPIALARSASHQSSPYGYQSSYDQNQRSQTSQSHQNHQMHGSLSSQSFNNTYGNGSSGRKARSQSADGRRDFERGDEDPENPDEWLARQMKKLQEKKASKHVSRNDWLAELKRALPASEIRSQSQSQNEYQSLQSQSTSEYRPSSTSRAETTPVSTATNRANISYSSDDDDDVEIDVFHRGRKIQRHHSESGFDRRYDTSQTSTRAPSQQSQSYAEVNPFPICPPTPYTNRPLSPGKPPRSPKSIRRYQGASSAPIGHVDVLQTHMERAQTPVNPRPIFMIDAEVKFAQDLSEHWYKPFASREETVFALTQSPPGSFVIRNSNSFPGAYGLAIKVSDTTAEKGIRHFLIEPTRFGVRLRGCGTLEPVFSSLSALVYAHSIECLALPITLSLPSYDILPSSQSQSTTAHLLRQGAACQLLFLGMVGVECLSGDEAISRGLVEITASSPVPISLRLSKSGLTLTDVFRKQFFRIHFALNEISYASVVAGRSVAYGREIKQVFGVVARAPRATENSVILLAELELGQPANAIVSFIQRVLAWQQH